MELSVSIRLLPKAFPSGEGGPLAVDEEICFPFLAKSIMKYNYNKKFVPISQSLRKRMTDEEKHLWYDFLKKLPLTVNRQKIIGNYIVDFYISQANIVIEIDGKQHEETQNKLADLQRDSELRQLGITILRYTNHDVNHNFHAVCENILSFLNISPNQ